MVTEEQIKKKSDEIKEKMRRFTLFDYEDCNGHVISCHVGIPAQKLKNDCRLTYTEDGKPRQMASSFFTKEEAENLISKGIAAASLKVAKWLLSDYSDEKYQFTVRHSKVIGYGYSRCRFHDWSKGPWQCKEFTIILKKNKYRNPEFLVVSSFPLIRAETQ